ncbi:MAG TPA: hypothetical protein GX714_17325 [Chloroflexi bacterium]|jgi:hypothetical protein|nr:hypothetical protein [Chloroflexota bacterium]
MARHRTPILVMAILIGVLAALVLPLTASAAPPVPPSAGEAAPPQPPVITAPPAWAEGTTVLAPAGLRLREGPTLGSRILLILNNGETVYPGAGPVWGSGMSWTYVRVWRWGRWVEGFAATRYLANQGGGETTPPPVGGLRVITPLGLRARTGPGLGYGIYTVFRQGTVLQPTGTTQWANGYEWAQVFYNGQYLWVAKAFTREV